MQQLRFDDSLLGGLDELRSLGEAVPSLSRLPEHGVGLGEPGEHASAYSDGSGRHGVPLAPA